MLNEAANFLDGFYLFLWEIILSLTPLLLIFFIMLKPDKYFSTEFREVGTHIPNNSFHLRQKNYNDFPEN